MTRPRTGPGWLVRLVAALPVEGALVISFSGLAQLARACRIEGWLAYLWPVTLDATGVVASLIWLDQRMPADARRAARWLAASTIVLSVAGNGLWHWLIDLGQRPHVLVQIGVGSVPPLVLFALLHVLALAHRRPTGPPAARPAVGTGAERPPGPWSGLVVTVRPPASPASAASVPTLPELAPLGLPVRPALADRLAIVIPASQPARAPASPRTRPAGVWTEHIGRARQVLDEYPATGRQALADALGIPTSQARQLLDRLRQPDQPAAPAGQTIEETARV
jgi:hypothetical protein